MSDRARLDRIWRSVCALVDSVREQERVIEAVERSRARTVSDGSTLKAQVGAYERAVVADVLHAHDGNVTNAARELGMTREGLHKVMRRHGLTRYGS